MNPYRLKNVFEYLTSNNQLLKKKLKLGTSEIPIPPKRSDVTTIEAINRFNKANPRVDTTNLKPLSVKHSNVRQSNVNEPNEGAIQSAFDTATRDAQFEGYPAPSYDKFKSRYLKKNMKADGGRIGFKGGADFATVADSKGNVGAKSVSVSPSGSVTTSRTRGPDGPDDRSNSQQNQNHREAMRNYQRPTESKIKKAIDVGSEASFLRNLYKMDPVGLGLNLGGKILYNKFIGDQSSLPTEEEDTGTMQMAELNDMQKKMLEGPQKNLKDIMGISNEEILENIQPFDDPETPATIEDVNKFYAASGGRAGYEDGGMLVQPSDDGSRPGYAKDLPEGISIRPHGKYPDQKYYTYQIMKDGKVVRSTMLKATPKNLKKIVDQREVAMNEVYPNRTSETEFKKLRKKYSKLNAQDFSKKLNKLGKKTFLGKDFNGPNVITLMSRYNIKSKAEGSGGFKKKPISEIKKIIRQSSGGLEFIKKFGDNENMLRKKSYTLSSMASKKTSTFSKGTSNESKQWLSLFRASNGGNRIKMIGTFNDQDISNIDNWPRNEKGKIDWSIKGENGEPAWKNVKFVDTEAPLKNATFEWNSEKKPNGQYKYVGGNLKNQIDNVFGEGFFRKSTAAYDLQAMSGTKNIMYKGQSLPPKQVIAKKIIETEYKKKYGKSPSKDYVQRRLNFVAFQEAHHPYGVANDPYFTELASRTANNRLSNIESKYRALIEKNPNNKNKLINDFKKEVRNLSSEYGNIRTGQVIDTGGLFGKKATPSELYQSGLAQADIKTGSSLYKKLMVFCPAGTATVTKAGGGRVPYADGPVCTLEEAARGMNEEIDKIKKGNASAGESSRTINKFKNLGSLGMRGLVKAGLVSEVFFEAALGFDRVISEGQSPIQAFRKSYLTAPLRAIGAVKSFEEGEREELLDVASDKGKVGRVLDLQEAVQNRDTLINKINNLETSLEDQQALDDGSGFFGSTEPLQKNIADLKAQLQDSYRDGQVNRADELFSTKPQDLNIKDQSYMDAYNNAIEKRAVNQASNSFKAQSIAADENRIREANKAMLEMFPMYTPEVIDSMYEKANIEKPENFSIDAFNNVMRDQDKMNYFAENFRLEKASGGIASLTKTIPPESGPTPHGLPYVYNNVKKI